MSILASVRLFTASAPVALRAAGGFSIYVPSECGAAIRAAPWLRMKARDGRGPQDREKIMTQLITIAELEGLNEQQLRAKYWQIANELTRQGKTAMECPEIYQTLRNIEAAIRRLKQRQPKPPGF